MLSQVFNCGTDKYVSYKAICDLIHSALNSDKEKDVKYMYFDPTLVSIVFHENKHKAVHTHTYTLH